MIGFSEGNGHPFSFSAIINGYNDEAFSITGWDVIHSYLRKRDSSEFKFQNAQVTHAWTQDLSLTEKLASACLIGKISRSYLEMVPEVDAVIIARDDFESHFEMTKPFLEAGKFVFVDKPLSLNIKELKYFKPYLLSGQLSSCSGLRYAKELDEMKHAEEEVGDLRLIDTVVVNSWEKYGIHMIEGVLMLTKKNPVSVNFTGNKNVFSFCINMEDDILFFVHCSEKFKKVFQLNFLGSKGRKEIEITDNFSAFRRTLSHFISTIETKKPQISPEITLQAMRLLIAGNRSREERREINIEDIEI